MKGVITMYVGILSNHGKTVSEEEAFDYALEELTETEDEELKAEFVEWFFSGNWVHKEDETE